MTKAKTKSPKPKQSPASPVKEGTLDSRGHKPGSRKAKVHELFDKEGDVAAFTSANGSS